jgi:hypothetical protein
MLRLTRARHDFPYSSPKRNTSDVSDSIGDHKIVRATVSASFNSVFVPVDAEPASHGT